MDLSKLLSWIPGWLGFLLLVLVGLAMTINGIANPALESVNRLGFVIFGLCAVLVGGFSWIAGASSEIKGRVGKVGVAVAVADMPRWAWLVDVALVAVATSIFLVGR